MDQQEFGTNQDPQEPAAAPVAQQKAPIGPIVGAAIVIALLIAGGAYVWWQQGQQAPSMPAATTTAAMGQPAAGFAQEQAQAQAADDSMQSLDADMRSSLDVLEQSFAASDTGSASGE